jgi:hypothetical protein
MPLINQIKFVGISQTLEDTDVKRFTIDHTGPYAVIQNLKTGHWLGLPFTKVAWAGTADYEKYQFLGRSVSHRTYKSSDISPIGFQFKLVAMNRENYLGIRWKAFPGLATINELSPMALVKCINWLQSLTFPQKSQWKPPDRLTISATGLFTDLDCVVESGSIVVDESAGFDNTAPRAYDVNFTFGPIFDLDKIPFRDDIVNGKFRGS